MAKAAKAATPALAAAEKAKVAYEVHAYDHDPTHESFGLEAAEKLAIDPSRVFKTLVASDGKDLFVGVVPVEQQLDLKALAHAMSVKSLSMADVTQAERVTGYVKGGISPLGQKKQLRTVIDVSAQQLDTMYVSAGKRGLEIELAPNDLAMLTRASFASIAR